MSKFEVQKSFVDQLRPFAKCSDTVWDLLLTEVESVGLSGLSKSATNLIVITKDAADRAGVLKHPGHANQAVHGNGGKNSKGGAGSAAGGETSANGDATPGQAIDEMGEGNDNANDILDNGLDENELESMSSADGESLFLAQEAMEVGLGHIEMIDPIGSEERLNGIRAQRALDAFGEASFHLRSSDHPVLQEAGMALKDMVESVANKKIDWNGSGNPAKASSY